MSVTADALFVGEGELVSGAAGAVVNSSMAFSASHSDAPAGHSPARRSALGWWPEWSPPTCAHQCIYQRGALRVEQMFTVVQYHEYVGGPPTKRRQRCPLWNGPVDRAGPSARATANRHGPPGSVDWRRVDKPNTVGRTPPPVLAVRAQWPSRVLPHRRRRIRVTQARSSISSWRTSVVLRRCGPRNSVSWSGKVMGHNGIGRCAAGGNLF